MECDASKCKESLLGEELIDAWEVKEVDAFRRVKQLSKEPYEFMKILRDECCLFPPVEPSGVPSELPCKYNIIFDLDETLLNTVMHKDITPEKLTELKNTNLIHFDIIKGMTTFLRPYALLLLKFVFEYFNVGFMTMGNLKYAVRIVDQLVGRIKRILPDAAPFFIVTREDLEEQQSHVVYPGLKNLDYFFDGVAKKFPRDIFKPCNTFIVDDNPDVVKANVGRCLQVPQFLVYYVHTKEINPRAEADDYLQTVLTPMLAGLVDRFPTGCSCSSRIPLFEIVDIASLREQGLRDIEDQRRKRARAE